MLITECHNSHKHSQSPLTSYKSLLVLVVGVVYSLRCNVIEVVCSIYFKSPFSVRVVLVLKTAQRVIINYCPFSLSCEVPKRYITQSATKQMITIYKNKMKKGKREGGNRNTINLFNNNKKK